MGRYDPVKPRRGGRYSGRSDKTAYQGVKVSLITTLALMLLSAAAGYYAREIFTFVQHHAALPIKLLTLSSQTTPEDTTTPTVVPKSNSDDDSAIQTLGTVDTPVLLPELNSSDSTIKEAVIALSPGLAPWLNQPELIKTTVAIINDLSQGQRSAKHLRFLKPSSAFTVAQNNEALVIAESSYHRYDALTQAINAIDAEQFLQTYKKFRPLVTQALNEFGYPEESNFEDSIAKAVAEILAAPILEQPPAVILSGPRYKFADAQLEALNPVHKQMLRLGPENSRIIQNKARLLLETLSNVYE